MAREELMPHLQRTETSYFRRTLDFLIKHSFRASSLNKSLCRFCPVKAWWRVMLTTVTRQVHRETSLKLPGYQTAALEPAVVVVDVFVVLVFVVVVVVVEGAEKGD